MSQDWMLWLIGQAWPIIQGLGKMVDKKARKFVRIKNKFWFCLSLFLSNESCVSYSVRDKTQWGCNKLSVCWWTQKW